MGSPIHILLQAEQRLDVRTKGLVLYNLVYTYSNSMVPVPISNTYIFFTWAFIQLHIPLQVAPSTKTLIRES